MSAPAAVADARSATPATSPASATAPQSKAPQPAASVRLTPNALPTATGRIAATGVAAAATIATAWALGAAVGLIELTTLTAAAALLFLTVMLGLRASAILAAAVISGALGAAVITGANVAGLPTGTLLVLIPVVMLTFTAFAFIAWSIPDVRMLGSGLIIGVMAAIVATAWPVLVALGVQRLIAAGHQRALVAAIAAPLLTWLAAAFGRSMASQIGATFSALRDGAFRVLTLVAAVAASLWAGASLEARFASVAVSTPFESLAPTIGWATAIGTFAPLLLIAWWLPGWVVRAQLRGHIEALAVGEPLTFLTFASMSALALWRTDSAIPLGRACWIALAGGAAYAFCRLRYAAPLPAPNAPLWIVIVGQDLQAMDAVVSNIADEWRAGQVTILAVPAAAAEIGGEHLQAAVRANQGGALFPQRHVHLQDWDDAQPPLWTAMPVRELYAVPELWPKILAERVDAATHIVALLRETRVTEAAPESVAAKAARIFSVEESPPSEDFFDAARRWGRDVLENMRRSTQTPQVLALFIPRSNGPSLRPDLSQQEAEHLADEVIAGKEPLAARLRAQRPEPAAVIVRHVIIQCAHGELEFADKLAQRLYGAQDRDGRMVESWVSMKAAGAATLRRLVRMPLGVWRHASIFVARLMESVVSERGSGLLGAVMRLVATLLERHWSGEFDVVVVESPGHSSTSALPVNLIETGRRRGIIARVVAVRTAAAEASGALEYPPSLYAGQIRVPAGRSTDVAVAVVADKLLALDFLSVEIPPATVAAPPAAAPSAAAAPAVEQMTAVFPPQSWLESCVQLEFLGGSSAICVAFAVDETLAISARAPIGAVPVLGVHSGRGQLEVLGASGEDAIRKTRDVLAALMLAGPEHERFATPLPRGSAADEDIAQAAVAGFVAGAARWYEVTLEPRTAAAGRTRRGTIVNPPSLPIEQLRAAFTGAPIVARERVVGVIVGVTGPQPNQSWASVELATTALLNEVVEQGKRDRETLQRARTAAPPVAPSDDPLVYISHARADERVALRIRDALEGLGIEVFMPSSLRPADPWQEQTVRAIERSVLFVTILSRQALSSEYVLWEWRIAEEHSWRASPSRYVVPLIVDDLSPNDARIPTFIRNLQWVMAPHGELPPSVLEMMLREYRRHPRNARVGVADHPEITHPSLDDVLVLLLPSEARQAVRDLITGFVSVIAASGPPQSALEELPTALQRPSAVAFRHIVIDISSWPLSNLELAERIAEGAGVDVKNMPRFEVEQRSSLRLARWLMSELQRGAPSAIVTLRGFDRVDPPGDLFELVDELIVLCTLSSATLRLVLLNYSRLPTVPDPSRIRQITLGPVDRAEVSSALRTLSERMGRRHDPVLIDRITATVFEGLGSSGSWQYGQLRGRLRQLARNLLDVDR